MDRPGLAGGAFPFRRWIEAGPAARSAGRADFGAGAIPPVYRRGRGARRSRADSSRITANSPGTDSAGCRRVGNHHDRCGDADICQRPGSAGVDSGGRWTPGGIRGLGTPIAGGPAPQLELNRSISFFYNKAAEYMMRAQWGP